MDLIEPLSGPEGVQYTPYYIYSPSQELMILASTDKLDMALKFADQFFDHDTSIIERFGEEGVDWTRDPEVLAENTNAYVEAGLYDALTLVVTSTFWNDNQSQTWRNHGPRYASAEMGNTTFDISAGNKYDPDDPTQLNAKNYELYNPKHPDAVLPTLHYTEDEASQVQDQLTNIPDFVKQSLAEFVVGTRDVETGWDSYLKELDSMGLQEWIQIVFACRGSRAGKDYRRKAALCPSVFSLQDR
jgi:putative aldouronate transport system substrate-binding protein